MAGLVTDMSEVHVREGGVGGRMRVIDMCAGVDIDDRPTSLLQADKAWAGLPVQSPWQRPVAPMLLRWPMILLGKGSMRRLGNVLESSRKVGSGSHTPAAMHGNENRRARRRHVGDAWGTYRRVGDMQGSRNMCANAVLAEGCG